MTTLHDLGECEVVRRLAKLAGGHPDLRVGIGDDAAVVPGGDESWDWVLTTDPVVEQVHFTADAPAAAIGHKAVGRVLSDLAAMGSEPLWLLVNVGAPATLPWIRLEQVYQGATSLARRFGATIIGGDMTTTPQLELHVFGMGRVPRGTALTRAGARPGDALYVTGALGGSRLGRHLAFEPRVREGAWLRAEPWATAMMDVSDGLAADLPRLCASSGVGAEIDAAAIPLHPDAGAMADGRPPLAHALEDGEDFELLFTVPADRAKKFELAWNATFTLPCTRIGTVLPVSAGLEIRMADQSRQALAPGGYEHYRT